MARPADGIHMPSTVQRTPSAPQASPKAPPARATHRKAPDDRSFRALLHARGVVPPRSPLMRRAETREPSKPSSDAASERAEALPSRLDLRIAPDLPEPEIRPKAKAPTTLEARAVEAFHVLPEARALRLRVLGKAGKAAVEVEIAERDGELALEIETEDGDRRRAEAWARAVGAALTRRGLRGHVDAS